MSFVADGWAGEGLDGSLITGSTSQRSIQCDSSIHRHNNINMTVNCMHTIQFIHMRNL